MWQFVLVRKPVDCESISNTTKQEFIRIRNRAEEREGADKGIFDTDWCRRCRDERPHRRATEVGTSPPKASPSLRRATDRPRLGFCPWLSSSPANPRQFPWAKKSSSLLLPLSFFFFCGAKVERGFYNEMRGPCECKFVRGAYVVLWGPSLNDQDCSSCYMYT